MNHAHTGGSRSRTSLFLLLIATFALGICATSLATGKKTSGVVYASANHAEGSDLYVSGDFNDKVLGRGAIVYVTRVSGTDQPGTVHVTAHKITLYTTKGSLSGPGAADQTFNPDGTGTITNGTFALKKGTGAYKGHSLVGTFTGSYDSGVYTFDYTATYK